jgi:hypothetical protein
MVKDCFKIKIDKIYKNSRTGQMTITLPKKKIKFVPKYIDLSCWSDKDVSKK